MCMSYLVVDRAVLQILHCLRRRQPCSWTGLPAGACHTWPWTELSSELQILHCLRRRQPCSWTGLLVSASNSWLYCKQGWASNPYIADKDGILSPVLKAPLWLLSFLAVDKADFLISSYILTTASSGLDSLLVHVITWPKTRLSFRSHIVDWDRNTYSVDSLLCSSCRIPGRRRGWASNPHFDYRDVRSLSPLLDSLLALVIPGRGQGLASGLTFWRQLQGLGLDSFLVHVVTWPKTRLSYRPYIFDWDRNSINIVDSAVPGRRRGWASGALLPTGTAALFLDWTPWCCSWTSSGPWNRTAASSGVVLFLKNIPQH